MTKTEPTYRVQVFMAGDTPARRHAPSNQRRCDKCWDAPTTDRGFPIQGAGGLTIPWPVAEQAYERYAQRHGRSQSLERLAERGGFGVEEMNLYVPDWGLRAGATASLQRQLAAAEERDKQAHLQWCAEVKTLRADLEEIRRLILPPVRRVGLLHRIRTIVDRALATPIGGRE